MHVIYSDLFKGVGIMAGGPFGCANENGLENCMYYPDKVDLNVLEKDSKTL
jgi:hypothetical protein